MKMKSGDTSKPKKQKDGDMYTSEKHLYTVVFDLHKIKDNKKCSFVYLNELSFCLLTNTSSYGIIAKLSREISSQTADRET